MLNRAVIHIKNLWKSLRWLKLDFNKFKDHLESRGYYSPVPCKLFLWKRHAKYFRVFDNSGACFFIKMKCEKDTIHESKVINHLDKCNSDNLIFFPKIFCTIIDEYCYNVFEYLEGDVVSRKSIIKFDLKKQMLSIVSFFHKINIVHRDIRPHNLMVENGILRVLDFEHCYMPEITNNNRLEELNEKFRPSNYKWDDAYSFKKILDQYLINSEMQDEYLELSDMVGKCVYEID